MTGVLLALSVTSVLLLVGPVVAQTGAQAGAQAGAQSGTRAATTATPEAPVPSVDWGRKTYVVSCTRCHGINLVTSSSSHFDLRTFPAADKERFERSVTQGIRAMPAWGAQLKPGQLESLWLYIGSVNGWPVTTTARTGGTSAPTTPAQ